MEYPVMRNLSKDTLIRKQINTIITNDTLFIVCSGSILAKDIQNISDIDFFIITEDTNKTKIYTDNLTGIKVEGFYYSRNRLNNCLIKDDHIIVDALSQGLLVFTKDETFSSKTMLKMRKLASCYKVSHETLIKLRYRFEMIHDKLIYENDNHAIRWLSIYSTPYILKTLFYINNTPPPALKQWIINVQELDNLPTNFSEKMEILLNPSSEDIEHLKNNLLSLLKFFSLELGHDKEYEIFQGDNDITTII